MKKTFLSLFLICVFCLTGCGNTTSNEEQIGGEAASSDENIIKRIEFEGEAEEALKYFMIDEGNSAAYEYAASKDIGTLELVHAVYEEEELISEETIDLIDFDARGSRSGIISVKGSLEERQCSLAWSKGDGKTRIFEGSIAVIKEKEGYTQTVHSKLFNSRAIEKGKKYPIFAITLSKDVEATDDEEENAPSPTSKVSFENITVEGDKVGVIYVVFA